MTNGQAIAGSHQAAARPHPEVSYGEVEEQHGAGWVTFAGVMIALAGVMDLIYGIAAIAKSHVYAAGLHFVFSNLNAWGWTVTFIGAFELCVAVGIWAGASWARWTGVVIAGLNAIAELSFIPAQPWLSLAVFTLDMLVIYGLIAYGRRLETV